MPSLARALSELTAGKGKLARLQAAATGRGPLLVRGVGAGRSFLGAALCIASQQTVLVATYSAQRGRSLVDDARDLLRGEPVDVVFYPEVASALYDGVLPGLEEIAQRLHALDRLAAGKPTLVVAPVQALMHLTVPREVWTAARMTLRKGDQVGRDRLAEMLLALGYQRVPLVEAPGQVSVRGGIVDAFLPTLPYPVRAEFFGDEVESLRYFDPASQTSTAELQAVEVPPAGEVLLDQQRVRAALPAIRSAFRRELDRLGAAGKLRERERLAARMEEDLAALERLTPTPQLLHYMPYLWPALDTLVDYLPEGAAIVVDEPARVEQAAQQFEADIARAQESAVKLGTHLRLPQGACLGWEAFRRKYLQASHRRRRTLYFSMLRPDVPWDAGVEVIEISTPPPDSFGGRMSLFVEGVKEWLRSGETVVVCTRQVEDTMQALAGRGLNELSVWAPGQRLEPGQGYLAEAELSAGFRLPDARAVLLTSREIFGWQKIRRGEEATYKPGFSLTSLRELQEGDYVVHIHHGIGVYRGLARQSIDGIEREYLLIEYAEGDRLYVPVTQLDRVQKYIGTDGQKPTVHPLRGTGWARQKRRAKRAALLLAQELLALYRAREQAEGHAFSPDSPWLHELEASFRWEETPDQLRAIEEIKRDMESKRPADRLVCGDVGFGKTEVAIRAAFKAVLDGKQVALLVPTTVLAEQHYHTFTERLAPYPVRVEMLSRFKAPAERRAIVAGLQDGSVDIVIGTHRLLMSDVRFKDLGLVIIDEEQRFGVAQKEKLKKLRQSVDVLTLTATPIPRTLNMALSGIRDISVINDPPRGRLPVRTYVRERDDDLIREAIRRELSRGGQVFFIHNRVQSIKHVAAHVQRLVPEARVAIGHGRMPEDELEHVMMAFYGHEIDVLVCTTIVENGLDVPNANTIIVDDADRMGLAQLYQLRGRVGRSDRQAYAYFLYRYPHRLTDEAEKRLRAIEEFAELGSGLKLALRDLEIRGAGNLLGSEQSGHIASVGLDMFCEMLADSVRVLKGDAQYLGDKHPTIDLPVSAVIPASYIEDDNQRIAAYRRLGAAQTLEEVESFAEELRDRYGPLPRSVETLVRLARLRVQCWEAGATELAWRDGKVVILLDDAARLSEREARMLVALYRPQTTSRGRTPSARLEQFTAREHEVSFACARQQPEKLLANVEEVMGLLADRARERCREKRSAETRVQ